MTTSTPTSPEPAAAASLVALVFAGGDAVPAALHQRLREAIGTDPVIVIAADSGLHHAQDGDWGVDLVIGDLDSVDPDRLAAAADAGATIREHPAAKAATDLELALDAAVDARPARIVVGGGAGGRLDHLLANVLLLASERFAAVPIAALVGDAWVHVVHDDVSWTGARGDLVTLLALGGPATGVTTSGLLYPLDGDTLQPGSTRGVSNEQLEPRATVTVTGGVLAVVRTGERGTHVLEAETRRDHPWNP